MVTTKDSGRRERFFTGAQRDTHDDKPRYDLIPVEELERLQIKAGGTPFVPDKTYPPIGGELPQGSISYQDGQPVWRRHPEYRPDLIPTIVINRLAHLYGRGARKYGDENWKKGIALSRLFASLFRHLIAWVLGDTSEDHMIAVIWNATAIVWTETEILYERLPIELADKGPITNGRTMCEECGGDGVAFHIDDGYVPCMVCRGHGWY